MTDAWIIKLARIAWQNRVFRHFFYWSLAFAVLYLSVRIYESHSLAMLVASSIILPAPVPVYLHLIAMKWIFERRRYLAYFFALVAIVVVSGLFIERLFQWIMGDPDAHISGIGVALFFIVFTTGFQFYSQGLRQKYLLQEAEFKRVQAELSLLRSQLHPHFFFNTLNNLYALSLERSEQVPGVIMKLAGLMRYVVDSSEKKTVPLKEEIQFLENYVELERIRLSSDADIRFQVDGAIEGRDIAPMILMPFVENGFKHGMKAAARDGFLHIRATLRGDRFLFIVVNSKPKRATRGKEGSSRIGLENIKRRLDLHYPGTHELSIREEDDKFIMELSITL
jgi:hypothetical protein